ncbi:MAG: hypothetical protein IPN07_09870 [Dehalococcoidia bacterium]|nr:hypothetical protein [Dehalococcoidia bacterium]
MGLRAGIEPLSDRAISGNRLSRSATPARLAGSAAARWAMAHVAIGEARERKKKRAILRTAEDVTRTMGEMKGAVMKVGQILSLVPNASSDRSTRRRLLPPRSGRCTGRN